MFADPADHVVAGLHATLPNGKKLEVRPGPRRAVGPDLTALALGTHDRLATVTHAWLRIHRLDARRPSLPLPDTDLDPPVTAAEARLVDAIHKSSSRARRSRQCAVDFDDAGRACHTRVVSASPMSAAGRITAGHVHHACESFASSSFGSTRPSTSASTAVPR